MYDRLFVHALLAATLAAATPAAALADGGACDHPEARNFDFWIGEWNVTNKRLADGGWIEMGRSAAKVYPILGGCALVEHWRGTAWGNKTIGFSVRHYDPASGKWFLLLSWPGEDRPGFGTLEGIFTHGRGEFFQERRTEDGEPLLTRYSFSDTKPDALRWDAAQSEDGGATWQTYWIMEFRRRPPGSLPLFHGPWIRDGRERRCSQPQAAELDGMAGGWQGMESRLEADGSWSERVARANVYPILEGCAMTDFVEVEGEGGFERFAIRAWVSRESRWVQYEMDTLDPTGFVRTAGLRSGDGIAFTTENDGVEETRVVWHFGPDGRLIREDARSGDDGVSWELVRKLELEPTFYGDRESPP